FDFQHVLVDEFQDTNRVQYELLKQISGERRNICVVGDDDQSIYSWRGARVENILDFRKDFPDATVVTLRSNYRSRSPILDAASRVINFNRRRHAKDLQAIRGKGSRVVVHASFSERDEAMFVVKEVRARAAEGVPYERMAVFYRTHAQSRVFEDALRTVRIPYRVIGGMKFYQRREVKDVIAYLRLLVNPADGVSLERIVNVPPRGIGAVTVQKVRQRAAETGKDLLMCLAEIGDEGKPALKARVRDFIEMITSLAALAASGDAEEVVRATLVRTGYMEHLGRENTIEAQNRVENVEELLASVREIGELSGKRDLMAYLDRVSLLQPLDQTDGSEAPDALNLMTVHAAKGLEFDHVFLCGLEEGLFPHMNSLGSTAALEEERRLMYVAMTRAREGLCLSHATTRVRFGGVHAMQASRFLSELPQADIRVV
ncbi:MAG: UvrD-helicase domain-containing protein, partial [Deltaproteobacteria bacterium]|nr:UvrD-helicase domain-containing protein [Deltaproteobacteria bacterium]